MALGYYTYLTLVAWAGRRRTRARVATLAASVGCWWAIGLAGVEAGTAQALVPMPILLVGYWLSGLFFVRPMLRLERWLLRIDDRLLGQTGLLSAYRTAPRAVREASELAYALVYPAIPAAVATLVIGGHGEVLPRFWAVVLLAEFACYGMLPWIQTRPPRIIGDAPETAEPPSCARRLNTVLLHRASIQVNTLPSGHAAGSVALAVSVLEVMPGAGLVFLALAAGIALATVLGRYHYAVDTILGALVGIASWWVVGGSA